MKGSDDLRKEFLDFFKKKGHKIVPSSSLIPDDPTVLFTTAGMQQFKPYFLEEKSPYGDRVVSCQASLRTSDIDSVGDKTHLTFFEMLGNFSFTSYFKKETIEWALEFLTKNCSLPENRLWFTYFKGNPSARLARSGQVVPDNESREILSKLGIPESRITGFDRDENFWGPTGIEGPCGPTAEIHFDLFQKPCGLGEKCVPNCKCGRFVEIWNLVFNEYFQDKNRKLSPLKQRGVDTGMGLERLAMAVQGKTSLFETDLFLPIIEEIEKNINREKADSFLNLRKDKSSRIVADHIRAAIFLSAEGIIPSNIGRGYILRRIIRRAIRHERILGLPDGFLSILAQKVIENYSSAYPDLTKKTAEILTIIQHEEEKFEKTLEKGLREFRKIIERDYIEFEGGIIRSSRGVLKPIDFKKIKKKISERDAFYIYETFGFPLELIEEEARGYDLGVDVKGFYEAQKEHQKISRAGVRKKFGGVGIEKVKSQESKIKVIKLHTATHLLHQALRMVLGNEVKQVGSDINPQRLRFDFSFQRKLTDDEIKEVENLVNQKIKEDLPVKKEEMRYEDASKTGALAFFKEKYPEIVKVYSINGFSKEICAGPHVENTGLLGQFKIIKEESVGAGIRRIRAVLIEKPKASNPKHPFGPRASGRGQITDKLQ